LFDQLFLALLIWLLLLAHLTPTIVVLESFGVDQLWPIIKNMISSATAGGGTGTGTSPAGSGNQMNQLAIVIFFVTNHAKCKATRSFNRK
jgi:hypothetical protein